MRFSNFPAGFKLWFHATTARFTRFSNQQMGQSNESNSFLGHFFSASIRGALQYVRRQRAKGRPAVVHIVAIPEAKTYAANEDEFWCVDEPGTPVGWKDENGFDPFGGAATRLQLMADGFKSIAIEDIDGTGPVKVVFDAATIEPLAAVDAETAAQMADWLDSNISQAAEDAVKWDAMKSWVAKPR